MKNIFSKPKSTSQQVQGERGVPSVNSNLSVQSALLNWFIFGCIMVATVFFLWKYYSHYFAQKHAAQEAEKHNLKVKTEMILPPLTLPPPPSPPPAQTVSAEPEPLAPHPINDEIAKQPSPAQLLLERREKSSVLFKVGGSSTSQSQPIAAGVSSQNAEGSLAERLQSTYTPGASATILPDRNLIIPKGTFMDCVMENALDSSLAGMSSCTLTRDIYGDNGKVVLLEKGTKLTGEYKGDVKQGQARLFVLWSRAETPKGVIINLDSPATDSLGRTGVDGTIDTHFWDRFGAAILLSIIDDAVPLITQPSISGNNNNITLSSTSQNTHDMATETLKHTIDIPPTLRQHQGAHINIFIARDLDFRGIYELKPKG